MEEPKGRLRFAIDDCRSAAARRFRFLALCLGFAAAAGCASVEDIQRLEEQIWQVRVDVKQVRTTRTGEHVADLGTQVSELRSEVARLRGDIEETRHEIRLLKSRPASGSAPSRPALSPPTGSYDRSRTPKQPEPSLRTRAGSYAKQVSPPADRTVARTPTSGVPAAGYRPPSSGSSPPPIGVQPPELRPPSIGLPRETASRPPPGSTFPDEPLLASNPVPRRLPTSRDELYKTGVQDYEKGRYDDAIRVFEAYLTEYPSTRSSDDALFYIGESYYRQRDYERAILKYDEVVNRYPLGDRVPQALLRQGFAFLELGLTDDAKFFFRKVTREFPRTGEARTAEKKLTQLQ